MQIIQKYRRRAIQANSLLCIGLDSDPARLPTAYPTPFEFNRWIIDQTHTFAAAYKLNTAFYERVSGWEALAETLDYLRTHHPDIMTICDAKRADIGNTSAAYARAFFDELGCDAITLNPFLGAEALAPFLDRADKACIILCRTSNPGAGEFQDLNVDGQPLWQHIARRVAAHWNRRENCMLVVGATAPQELQTVRGIVRDMPILVPGIGAQGGDLAQLAPLDNLLLTVSRGIIFADDPAQASADFHAQINALRTPPG
ncbi:MAG: orotidine-5'-phosphate decarboxylase [Anaerolineales bacterium]